MLINTSKELIRHIGDNCLEPSVPYSEYWIEQLADHDSCYEIMNENSGQAINEETWPKIITSKNPKAISLVLLEKKSHPRDRQNLLADAVNDDITDSSSFDHHVSSSDSPPESMSGPPDIETESATILAAVGNSEKTPVVFRARGHSRGRSSRRSSWSPQRIFAAQPQSDGSDTPRDIENTALVKHLNAEHRFSSPNKFDTRSLDLYWSAQPPLYSNSDAQDYPIRPVSDMGYYKSLGKGTHSNGAYSLSSQRKILLDMASHSRIKNPNMLYYIPPVRRAFGAAWKTNQSLSRHSPIAGLSGDLRLVRMGSTDKVIPEQDVLSIDLEKSASPADIAKLSKISTNNASALTPDAEVTSLLATKPPGTSKNGRDLRSELNNPVRPTSFPKEDLTHVSDSPRSSSDNIQGAGKEKHLYRPFFLWPIWSISTHRSYQLESGKPPHHRSGNGVTTGSGFEVHQNYTQQKAFLSTERSPEGASSMEDNTMLYNILDEICDRLGKSKASEQFDLYRRLSLGEEADAATAMLNLRNKQNSQGAKDTREDYLCTEKETILVLASKILSAFIPNTCHAEILKKYWGGVQSILMFEVC